MTKLWGLLVLAGLLSGCATLSEEECFSVDWQTLGYQDVLAGHGPQRIDQHGQACAKAGIAADAAAWQAGYVAGLPEFCVGGQGYVLGARNGSYYQQCPDELEDDFEDGYRLGQERYDLKQRISAADQEIARLRDEMNDEDTSEIGREAAGRWLDHYKRERERLDSERWRIDSRASERGYPTVY